ncbi:MAG: hypothetical protein IPP56_16045 [Bacteroidetes bacterium]|nr:hypothetical protein [Bacteroidota bacterium]MBK9801161.1 hypothetical protein [Bacteroidota bacterium]MBP6411910.1 hypothetical protein [Bacteroidia bacterium]
MSWLYSLVDGLTEVEIESVQNLRLIGKEAELLECYIAFSKNGEEPEITFLKNKLKISDTHVYKIQSVLVDKLLLHFAPMGKLDLLEWLRQKELYPLLKYEIKSQLKKKNSTEYYLETFRLLIDLPYKYYDEKLVTEAGKHYLKTLHPCKEADKKYVQFHLLFANCNRFAASKNPALFFGYAENDLLKMESDLLQDKYYLALYYLYRTLCNYYKYYKKEASLSLHYLQKASLLEEHIAPFFTTNIKQFLRLLYADALLGFSKVEEAFTLYTELFKEGIQESMYGYYYHCEQYAITAILLNKYKLAQKFISARFDSCIEKKNDIYATRGVLAYAKLYLSCGEVEKAHKYIQLGLSINEKSFYLPFEIQLRVLENCYFILLGDYTFAKQLSTRNLKYVRNQKNEALKLSYLNLFKLLTTIAQQAEQNKDISQALQSELDPLLSNLKIVFGKCLEKTIDSCASKK